MRYICAFVILGQESLQDLVVQNNSAFSVSATGTAAEKKGRAKFLEGFGNQKGGHRGGKGGSVCWGGGWLAALLAARCPTKVTGIKRLVRSCKSPPA